MQLVKLLVLPDDLELLGGVGLSDGLGLGFVGKVGVDEAGDEKGDVDEEKNAPDEKNLDEGFVDEVDFLLVETQYIIQVGLGTVIFEHLLDPY